VPACEKVSQLTHNPEQDGISNFSASSAGLVMGDAASSVDVLDRLWHGKAIQIGDGSGDDPVINNAGQKDDAVAAPEVPPSPRSPYWEIRPAIA
jgi:hypothetical protein